MRAANIPIIPDHPLPKELDETKRPLIVGLTREATSLVQIRRNRLGLAPGEPDTPYTDPEAVRREVLKARQLCARRGWPVIDVTRRSIEEIVAAIMQLYDRRDAAS